MISVRNDRRQHTPLPGLPQLAAVIHIFQHMFKACLGPLIHAAGSAHRGHFRVISPTTLSEKYKLESLVLRNYIYLLVHFPKFPDVVLQWRR